MAYFSSLFQPFSSIEYGFLGKKDLPKLPLLLLDQIHSADVLTAPSSSFSQLPKADAWVTNQRNIYLGIKTADCVPVLLYDPDKNIIGAAHAGWRGSLAGIIKNTVQAMKDLGASPSSIRAVIGPAISQENYEVGQDVRHLFMEKDSSSSQFFDQISSKAPSKFLFDLKGFVKDALEKEGIPVSFIDVLPLDTYTQEETLYSHRYVTHQGKSRAGDNIAFIGLRS